jgi:hypothetical protein
MHVRTFMLCGLHPSALAAAHDPSGPHGRQGPPESSSVVGTGKGDAGGSGRGCKLGDHGRWSGRRCGSRARLPSGHRYHTLLGGWPPLGGVRNSAQKPYNAGQLAQASAADGSGVDSTLQPWR